MAFKLDIFRLLTELDKRSYTYYDKLEEDQKKEVSPLILLRWMSSAPVQNGQNVYYLLACNEINKNLFKVNDKRVLVNSFASIGLGRKVMHNWIKGGKLQKSKMSALEEELKKLFNINHDEYKILLKDKGLERIKYILIQYGYNEKDIKSLIKSGVEDFE